MSDLFQLVRDHIEATDQITQEWQTAEGPKTLTRSFSRPVAWIEKVHERGVLTALDCLSIIFFALDDWHALPTREQEIQLAEGWAAELRQAAHAGEIQARDPFTLLPLTNTPEGWDWGLSTSDADRFLAARGMSWRCGEIASHIYNEVASEIEAKRFPPFLDKSAHSTAAPVEADSASDAPDTSKGTPPKLTEVDKAEILRLYNRGRGASVNAMAKQFNVSRPTIEKVLQRAGIKK